MGWGSTHTGRIQEWGAEIAPQPTQAPHLAPPHTSAQPAFNLPLDSNIFQFTFFIASSIVTLVTCKRYFKGQARLVQKA